MTIHPIRLTGLVVGVQQSFDYLERMQDRVIRFITSHSDIKEEKVRELMMTTGELAQDVGTIVVGEDAVKYGLIDEVGGLGDAIKKLNTMIEASKTGEQAVATNGNKMDSISHLEKEWIETRENIGELGLFQKDVH